MVNLAGQGWLYLHMITLKDTSCVMHLNNDLILVIYITRIKIPCFSVLYSVSKPDRGSINLYVW
jgi:hypothetical protein